MMNIRVQSANTAYIYAYHLGQNCTCNKNEDAMQQNDHGNEEKCVILPPSRADAADVVLYYMQLEMIFLYMFIFRCYIEQFLDNI